MSYLTSYLVMTSDKIPHRAVIEEKGALEERPLGRRVLIVEDETMVALHLESLLQELGFEVCNIVSTGSDAVKETIAAMPDAVFMDINLADDIDGIDAAQKILKQVDVPIVFVTAYVDDKPTIERITTTVGQSIVIGKPATMAAMHSAIQKLRRRS